jgi:hypothetical protein
MSSVPIQFFKNQIENFPVKLEFHPRFLDAWVLCIFMARDKLEP